MHWGSFLYPYSDVKYKKKFYNFFPLWPPVVPFNTFKEMSLFLGHRNFVATVNELTLMCTYTYVVSSLKHIETLNRQRISICIQMYDGVYFTCEQRITYINRHKLKLIDIYDIVTKYPMPTPSSPLPLPYVFIRGWHFTIWLFPCTKSSLFIGGNFHLVISWSDFKLKLA